MRKPKSEFDERTPHYGGGRCSRCYYISRSSDATRRYDWSKPRYCATCKKLMRSNHEKSDGITVKHGANGICINCKAIQERSFNGSKTRTPAVWDENGQVCKSCDRHLPFVRFPIAPSSPSGRRSKCMWCQKIWDSYRLTFARYSEMLEKQEGNCASCGELPNKGSLVVDHDHSCCKTEKTCGLCVRGLLCMGCNLSLGHVRDSVTRLNGLISYLNKYPS